MASLRRLCYFLIHLLTNLSFTPPKSRTQPFIILLLTGALFSFFFFFFFFSTSDNSPIISSTTLTSHIHSVYPLYSILSLKSDLTRCHTSATVCPVTAVKSTRRKNTHSDKIRDITSCDIFDGRWIKDNSDRIYKPGTCPYVGDSFNCFKNGRIDSDYLNLRWKPHGCRIPRFNGLKMLKMLKGKRLVFVGDSLNRNMWESLICSLRESLVDKSNLLEVSGRREFRTEGFYSFRFQDYNCSIDFIKSPFLVEEWNTSDKAGSRRETLRLDLIEGSSTKYHDADIIIFNTGHWWTHQKTYKGNNYFQEGNRVYTKLEVADAYTRALKTWAQWVDSNVNPSKTRIFFRGYSASHFRGGQWNSGGNCDGEMRPITNDTFLSPYPWMMKILESVISDMKTPVFYLNITKMSDYRKDGHPSVYRQVQGQRVSAMVQDCSHWCLPGVPDSWNELLYAALLISHYTLSLV